MDGRAVQQPCSGRGVHERPGPLEVARGDPQVVHITGRLGVVGADAKIEPCVWRRAGGGRHDTAPALQGCAVRQSQQRGTSMHGKPWPVPASQRLLVRGICTAHLHSPHLLPLPGNRSRMSVTRTAVLQYKQTPPTNDEGICQESRLGSLPVVRPGLEGPAGAGASGRHTRALTRVVVVRW